MKLFFALSIFFMSGIVFAGPTPGAPSGHPSVESAARTLNVPAETAGVDLPYEGKVLQAIPSNAYVFVEVETANGVIWLSAPVMELNKGDVVRYGRGTMMINFYSKKQKVTFPKIMFVGRVLKSD